MQIARVTPHEHSDFLNLVNAEIRPDRAKTNAWDDFPLVLAPENCSWMLAIREADGSIAAGLACLIREFVTTWGNLYVAGLGSVVTRPDCRGRGYSTALQIEMLAELKRKKIPLAVLWTDQPEIYAGRGFEAAGWEAHVDLLDAELDLPEGWETRIREYRPEDASAIEVLYHRHALHTIRQEGDSEKLYGMPGTSGLVLCDGQDRPLASVFCGKGADFPDYVTEWSGPVDLVIALLGQVRARGWASRILAPAGTEDMVNHLVDRGAGWFALPSGYWMIPDTSVLEAAAQAQKLPVPDWTDIPGLLGNVLESGEIAAGTLEIAVWGFDSV